MKKMIAVLTLAIALASPAFAHCGKCGMEGEHKQGASAHSGAQCPMHGEKNAVLQQAAKALEASDPALAAKLNGFADNCCGEHKAA